MQERSSTLRDVIEELAELERGAGSPGEEVAAHRLRGRFEQLGCDATVDEEVFLDGYARMHAALSAVGALAGLAALSGTGAATRRARRRRRGRRDRRRLRELEPRSPGARLAERRTTWNVVAETGDRTPTGRSS